MLQPLDLMQIKLESGWVRFQSHFVPHFVRSECSGGLSAGQSGGKKCPDSPTKGLFGTYQSLHQAINGVRVRFHGRVEPELGERFARFRANGRQSQGRVFFKQIGQIKAAMEMFDA